jgi:sugar phosphate isomerase/epimerase
MNSSSLSNRIAVCSWSLQPNDPQDLLSKLQQTGINRVQLALDPLRNQPKIWGETPALLARHGISIVSGMFGCVGEDYSTLESIRRTGGVAPDETWEQNWKNIQSTAALTQQMGLKLVTFHAGFLPHEETDPSFVKLLRRINETAEIFSRAGITLAFETGQESAPVLLQVLSLVKFQNIGVNFDPANMLLYDKGDPVESLRALGRWVRQVHIKDATRTKVPGEWGEEVPAGTGEVNWPAFFSVLKELKYDGNLVIEREAGSQRIQDIQAARKLLESMSGRLGN